MLQACHKLHSKPVIELKEALQVIWDSLPQEPINKDAIYAIAKWSG